MNKIRAIIERLHHRLKNGKYGVPAFISLLFISNILNGQAYTGWNGAGFFDVYPSQVKEWMDGNYVLRYRADQKSGVPDNINQLIELNTYYNSIGKAFKIIYCAGLIETTPEENVEAIKMLLDNNVEILSVELDNEPYNQKICNFDFDCYKFLFEPHVNAIRKNWPSMHISYFIAPRPKDSGVMGGSERHAQFNNDLAAYLETYPNVNDEISVHIYFNSREIPTLTDSALIAKRPYDPEIYYQDLDYFYTSLFYSGYENIWLWDSTLNYLSKKFPDRNYNITEFGTDESGKYKNTVAYHALMSMVWNSYKHYPGVKTLLEHNGNAKAGAGCITPASEKYDFNPNGFTSLIRMALPTWKMQNNRPNKSSDVSAKITSAGSYQYHFVNMGAVSSAIVLNYDTSLAVSDGTIEYITGTNSYSSMGACPFMGPGTIKNYEITGTTVDSFTTANEIYVPAWSYGYLNVTFIQKEVPVICPPKCSKRWYFTFHWKKCKACVNE